MNTSYCALSARIVHVGSHILGLRDARLQLSQPQQRHAQPLGGRRTLVERGLEAEPLLDGRAQ